MSSPIDDLLALLSLERSGDQFAGHSLPTSLPRIFGGQVVAQALMAGGLTVEPDRGVHSLHAYFLRPGDPRQPVDYHVERMRDGRGFSLRRVTARQDGRVTFAMTASFHLPEASPVEHTTLAPPVPSPDELPSLDDLIAPYADRLPNLFGGQRAMEIRPVRGLAQQLVSWWAPQYSDHPSQQPGGYPGEDVLWFRANGEVPDDPLLHACIATYFSDMTLQDAVARRHGAWVGSGHLDIASLDHAMWFHAPFRADRWSLYATGSPVAGQGLGYARGRMFAETGELLISCAQEGLFRKPTTPGQSLFPP
ncbi:MAG: acyl-CoA thioesterase [Candidatus Nanopelagicales bacterium]